MNVIEWLKNANVQAALIGAAVAGTVSMIGWLVSYYQQERVRQLESRRAFLRRQIEEFYAPMFALVQRKNWIQAMQDQRTQMSVDDHGGSFSDEWARILKFFSDAHILPLRSKIAEYLQTKSFLMEEKPNSFQQFLQHDAESSA